MLICGSRDWSDAKVIEEYIITLPPGSIVITGMARGADLMARRLALKHGYKTMDFFANWNQYGNAAGPIRNKQMIDQGKPDRVVAFHDNLEESKGTKDMLEQASKANLIIDIKTSKQ